MRCFVGSMLLALAIAAPLHAAEAIEDSAMPEDREAMEEAMPAPVAAEAPSTPEMRLEAVEIRERVASDDAAAAQWPQRGSFWWMVGVIVVAGVILAVLL